MSEALPARCRGAPCLRKPKRATYRRVFSGTSRTRDRDTGPPAQLGNVGPMHMTLRALSKLGMILILTASCATQSLWKATDPSEYLSVRQDEVSESELQERGVRYRKDNSRGVYYVEKTSLRRLGDYTVRAFGAPATVVLDTATAIVVVGTIGAIMMGEDCRIKGGCHLEK